MMAVIVAMAAALGVFYFYTALALRWPGLGFGPRVPGGRRTRRGRRADEWLAQAGLGDVALSEFGAVMGVLFLVGALAGFLIFGAPLPALVLGAFSATLPLAAYRRCRAVVHGKAQEAWPRMIEEVRILTGAVGRSVPQALFEADRSAPTKLRPAFDAAQREWLLSTHFGRTVDVLKARLAETTADAAGETLLIAHELGGSDLDQRLAELGEDRRIDLRDHKDSRARQAGARFARWFVIIAPLGMAAAGLSIGSGRDAYQTPVCQALVVLALAMIVGCWWVGVADHAPARRGTGLPPGPDPGPQDDGR
jgi:tight adherence protein B